MKTTYITLFTLALFVAACGSKKTTKKEVIRPVRYQQVHKSGGKSSRTFSGVARASTETRLSFKVSGTIQVLNVKVGQQVKAGQLIASVDAADYVLQYEDAKASLRNVEAQRQNAQSSYNRLRQLYENNNASLSDYEKAKTGYESAKATVNSIKKKIALAQSQINYTKIVAPRDGVVAEVLVETNENVSPGRPIVQLDSGKELEVKVDIPEVFIAKVKSGDTVQMRFSAQPQTLYKGIVHEVAFTASRGKTTYPVTVKILNPDQNMRPSMTCNVTFVFDYGIATPKMLVPAIAVRQDVQGKRYVFTVKDVKGESSKVVKQVVKVGDLTEEGIEIMQGLKESELVVTAGVSKLKDGQKVRLSR
ncbi:efflux RND transporter periplasmic adaptor subunit [Microscilla marina]|uniref:RND efflux system membrane fusion protein n=1 Tax=Microscilla marina ATCC 23134 TaxID=313606 RepID=A2A048_MICM2|nr:efflux RND transporter periplasmic adaptor subunit [Microscilla marina]EAY23986.1 RND efflux system membrane fusion protein [Microscilla marina ATCC 23134]